MGGYCTPANRAQIDPSVAPLLYLSFALQGGFRTVWTIQRLLGNLTREGTGALPQLYPKLETRYEAWLKQHAAASLNWKFPRKM